MLKKMGSNIGFKYFQNPEPVWQMILRDSDSEFCEIQAEGSERFRFRVLKLLTKCVGLNHPRVADLARSD